MQTLTISTAISAKRSGRSKAQMIFNAEELAESQSPVSVHTFAFPNSAYTRSDSVRSDVIFSRICITPAYTTNALHLD